MRYCAKKESFHDYAESRYCQLRGNEGSHDGGGALFSLGSTSAIANIIAGYMMTYLGAFKVGDRVRIGDAIGTVIQTRL